MIVGVPLNVSGVVPLLVTVNASFFTVPAAPDTVPKASVAGTLTSVAVPVRGSCSEVFESSGSHDDIWLVSFMDYDLGYFDLETRVLEPLENPFGPKVLPM